MPCLPVVLILSLVLSCDAAGLAADAAGQERVYEQAFKVIYARELQDVADTELPLDDARLAWVIYNHAMELPPDDGFRTYLLERTFDFGRRARVGFIPAVKALDELVVLQPDRAVEHLQQKLDLFERELRMQPAERRSAGTNHVLNLLEELGERQTESEAFADATRTYGYAVQFARRQGSSRADELQRMGRETVQRQATSRRMAVFKKRLEASPDDAKLAAMLARLCVVELDQPHRALPYLEVAADEELSRFVPLAVKPVLLLDEDDVLPLADWYRSLAESTTGSGQTAMLMRAIALYERAEDILPASSPEAVRVRLRLASLRTDATRLDVSTERVERAVTRYHVESSDRTVRASVKLPTGNGATAAADVQPQPVPEPSPEPAPAPVAAVEKPEPKPEPMHPDPEPQPTVAELPQEITDESAVPANWRPLHRDRVEPREDASIFDF